MKIVPVKEMLSLGDLRNIGVMHATGEIIAHWNEGECCRPHRITHQVILYSYFQPNSFINAGGSNHTRGGGYDGIRTLLSSSPYIGVSDRQEK